MPRPAWHRRRGRPHTRIASTPAREVAQILKQRMGKHASKVSTRILPNWVVRLAAWTNPSMKAMVPLLGVTLNVTNEKAKRLLAWSPRPTEEAIVATAESLLRLGLVRSQ